MNAQIFFKEFDLKAKSLTDTITKVDQLSKLVTGGEVTLKNLQKSSGHNSGEQGTLWVIHYPESYICNQNCLRPYHIDFYEG